MAQLSTGLLLAGQALTLMAIAWLAWRLRGERRARAAAEAALAAQFADAESLALRMKLLERRASVIAPIDTLYLSWSRGTRPDGGDLVDALKAVEEARLLFSAGLAEALEQSSAQLLAYIDHVRWQRSEAGSRFDHHENLERELELEAGLKPRIQELRARLAAEARVGDFSPAPLPFRRYWRGRRRICDIPRACAPPRGRGAGRRGGR